jgi:methylmalonyl-CoA epimerase
MRPWTLDRREETGVIRGLRSISVAVSNMERALGFYRDALGLRVLSDLDMPERSLHVVRLELGSVQLELMESTGPTSPIEPFLLNRGQGLHHVTLEVEDIELEMRTLMARGAELIDRTPREGLDGQIAFVNPGSSGGVLLALNESPAPSIRPEGETL